MPKQDAPITRYFADLPDPRMDRTKKHSLGDIPVITLCAVVAGTDSWEEVEAFGEAKADWLRTFLALPNGIPSHGTFYRVFSRLDPQAFGKCVADWMAGVCEVAGLRHVAVDGKAVRSAPEGHVQRVPAPRQCVGRREPPDPGPGGRRRRVARDRRHPRNPPVLDLKGALVTIDAAGCQKEIAKQIRNQGGHYLLAVNGNQPTLQAAVHAEFDWLIEADFVGLPYDEAIRMRRLSDNGQPV
ncbi:ISAs1 family transposase [Limnoglobus roseus]|nr:ISAs1 family transposase [Limnoglobus roseus]